MCIRDSKYYSKLGCFCFEKQELKAGEKATYVMTFYLDPELVNDPTTKNLKDVTMSYTFLVICREKSVRHGYIL